MARWRSFLLSYIRVEPSARFAPAPSSLPRKRPDSGTARACAGRPGLEPGISGVKARWVCRFPYRPTGSLRPGSNGLPAVYKTATLPGELRRHRVLGAIRTHTASTSGSCLLPIGLRGHRSRRPVPIRTARLTRAGPQPCAAANASGAGLEPARARVRALLGTADAPPGNGTGGEIRTLMRPGLSRPGIPVPVTPASCAARATIPHNPG